MVKRAEKKEQKENIEMNNICNENIEKLGNHGGRLFSLEKKQEEDNLIKDRIFNEIKETNNKVNKIDKDISILKNSFEGFKTNITNNQDEFKEDMKSLFNSIFTKSMAVLVIVTIIGKAMDKFFK